jgi:hypothetical protein
MATAEEAELLTRSRLRHNVVQMLSDLIDLESATAVFIGAQPFTTNRFHSEKETADGGTGSQSD